MSHRVTLQLADKSYTLRYSLAALKRIKTKFAQEYPPKENEKDPNHFFNHPVMRALREEPETAIPYLFSEGVENEKVSEVQAAELISGPDMEDISIKVVEAFFGHRQAEMLGGVKTRSEAEIRKFVEAAGKSLAEEKKPEAVAETTPVVQ